jgi:hypothetical protein
MDGYEYKNLLKFLQYKECPVNYTLNEKRTQIIFHGHFLSLWIKYFELFLSTMADIFF